MKSFFLRQRQKTASLKKLTNQVIFCGHEIAIRQEAQRTTDKRMLVLETPHGRSKAVATRKGKMSDMPNVVPQSCHAPPRRDRGGQNTCLDIPFAGVRRSALSRQR